MNWISLTLLDALWLKLLLSIQVLNLNAELWWSEAQKSWKSVRECYPLPEPLTLKRQCVPTRKPAVQPYPPEKPELIEIKSRNPRNFKNCKIALFMKTTIKTFFPFFKMLNSSGKPLEYDILYN